MLRLTRVFATAVVLAVLFVPMAATQEEATRTPKQVVVTAKCPNNDNGPLSVTVNPWVVTIEQDDDTRWILKTNRPQDNEIRIEAKESSDWPYPVRMREAKDKVLFQQMKANAENDDYYYNVTVHCGVEKIVIDPRVRVR
jgi:hypothetical protein